MYEEFALLEVEESLNPNVDVQQSDGYINETQSEYNVDVFLE